MHGKNLAETLVFYFLPIISTSGPTISTTSEMDMHSHSDSDHKEKQFIGAWLQRLAIPNASQPADHLFSMA